MRRGPFDPIDPFSHRPQRRPEMTRPAAAPVVAAPKQPDPEALREHNQRLREELEALSERYVELQEDLSRVRARQDEAVHRARQEERERSLGAVFEVADALDRAVADASERESAWFTGIERLRRGVMTALQRRGVERLGLRGEPFDPSRHEALGTARDAGVPEGYVVTVERTGYADASGALLRPAGVIVALDPDGTE